MNYYERIQRSIDYIEDNLEDRIDLKEAAKSAYMSSSNYYRLFFALVGFPVKEYVRLRRISMACRDLTENNDKIIDIAIKYDYSNPDAFTKSFKKVIGMTPSEFSRSRKAFIFERVSVLDKFYEVQDKELLDKYPDIKVLKELEPKRVAYYCYYGENPEENAFNVIKDWFKESGITKSDEGLRVFGYNNPSPTSPEQKEYGYEVCVTIPDNLIINHELIKAKNLDGGLYAVVAVRFDENEDFGLTIYKTWKRFNKWLGDSKYSYGGHQWLEEHMDFSDDFDEFKGIDLYMPISEKTDEFIVKGFEDVESMKTITMKCSGKNAMDKCLHDMLSYADQKGFFDEGENHRYFAYYNFEKIGSDDFAYRMHISVDEDFNLDDDRFELIDFPGGHYAVMSSIYKSNQYAWGSFISWKEGTDYQFGNYTFFEEYLLDKPLLEKETKMKLHLPIIKS